MSTSSWQAKVLLIAAHLILSACGGSDDIALSAPSDTTYPVLSDTTSPVLSDTTSPVLTADAQTLQGRVNQPLDITLTGSNPENEDEELTYTIIEGNGYYGELTGEPPNLTFVPKSEATHWFKFTVSDGTHTSLPSVVRVEVLPGLVADAQTLQGRVNQPLDITLTGSNPENEDEELTYTIIEGNGYYGELTGEPPNLTFVPKSEATHWFKFTVSDGTHTSPASHVQINASCQQPSLDDAYDYFNKVRATAGMITMTKNEKLQTSAQNHADYQNTNDTTGHDEDPSKQGFTGESPSERAIAAGYFSTSVGEGISYRPTPKQSINALMTAIYHRFDILHLYYDQVGIGLGVESDQCLHNFTHNPGNIGLNTLCEHDTYTSGRYYYGVCAKQDRKIPAESFVAAKENIAVQNPRYILWPADGMSGASPVFYEETPDPLPDYSKSGNPLSIQFNPYYYPSGISLVSFKLYDDEGNEITNVRLLNQDTDPNKIFDQYQYALFPLDVLETNTIYKGEVIFKHGGVQQPLISWQFTTSGSLYL